MKNPTGFNSEFFETVACNLCGNSSENAIDIVFEALAEKIPKTKEEFCRIYSSASDEIFYEQIVRCKKCGLIYISPRPRKELICEGYSSACDERYVSQAKGREITFNHCVKIIQRFIPRGKLLDIGAAAGIFVKSACDAGYDALGVEPSRWMCDMGREKYDVTIKPGYLEQMNFPPESFDIITLWDVLEHVSDPMKTLLEIKRILKPNGFLIINYPRIDDFLAKIFKRKWWFLLSVHLFYFTPRTLSVYLEKTGFIKKLHKAHFQQLSYGYLVERLKVYSPALANLAKLVLLIPHTQEFLIPYFASQYLMVAQKKS